MAKPEQPPDPSTLTLTQTYSGHTDWVWSVALAAESDGRLLLATGSRDGSARIWDAETGTSRHTLVGHSAGVCSVAWATPPDGRPLLATGSIDGTAQIWDAETGVSRHTFAGHDKGVNSVALVQPPGGGLLLATGGIDKTVRIWNADSGECVRTLRGHTAAVKSVDWHLTSNGRPRLATGGADKTARIWDATTGDQLHQFDVGETVNDVRVSTQPDGRMLLAAGHQGLTIWHVSTGDLLRMMTNTRSVSALAWLPVTGDSPLLASASFDGSVRVWNAVSGRCLTELRHPNGLSSVHPAVVRDGRLALATGCDDHQARLWTTERPSDAVSTRPSAARDTPVAPALRPHVSFWLDRTLTGHLDRVWTLDFATQPDGSLLLASGSSDSTVRIWDYDTGACMATLDDHTGTVYSVAWEKRPDGRLRLASGSQDATARIWDVAAGTCLRTLNGHTSWVGSAAWGEPPDGRTVLATGAGDFTVRTWDGDTGACLSTIAGQPGSVRSVSWAVEADGQALLAIGRAQGIAQIVDGHEGSVRHELRSDPAVMDINTAPFGFHPDGRLLVATGADSGEVRVWDARTGACLRTLTGHTNNVLSAAWATLRDGRLLLATAGWDNDVRVWDPEQDLCLGVLGHPDHVNGVAVTTLPDGRLVMATACSDKVIRLWTTTTAVASPRPEPPRDGGRWSVDRLVDRTPSSMTESNETMCSVAWQTGPDGRLLASSDTDGCVQIRDANTGALLDTHHDDSGLVRTVAWAPDESGPALLALASGDGARIWDPGSPPVTLEGHTETVESVAWIRTPAGERLLATGSADGTARIWDARTRECLRVIPTTSAVITVAWTPRTGGHGVLATAGVDGVVRLWAVLGGEPLGELLGHTSSVHCAEWVALPDGRRLLATASSDGTARIWDTDAGRCVHVLQHTDSVWGVSWAVLTDGRLLLATSSRSDLVLWDAVTGVPLHTASRSQSASGVVLARAPDGRLVLVTGADGVRVLEVVVSPPEGRAAADVVAAPVAGGSPPAGVVRGLVSLSCGGMWLPLGLVADVVSLTGRGGVDSRLHDPRLGVLAQHPGVELLRGLGWSVSARVAFAALLAASLPADPVFEPPVDTGPADRRAALDAALRGPTVPVVAADGDVAALTAAADRVSARMITLLGIIGSDAAATDPLLVLRLAHHVPALPELTSSQRTLLAAAGSGSTVRERANASSTVRAAGSTGVTRAGPLTTVLLTEHALPREIFTLRYVGGQLLHRHHPATATPPVGAITLILDTTPPVWGPPESLLRLTAHLITQALWRGGQRPLLVTLTDPGVVRVLDGPSDLLTLWTSRTLEPPDPAVALRTATAAARHPTLTLTGHRGLVGHPGPSAQDQLFTTHHRSHPPARGPTSRYHHHLPPHPGEQELTSTVTAILALAATPADQRRRP